MDEKYESEIKKIDWTLNKSKENLPVESPNKDIVEVKPDENKEVMKDMDKHMSIYAKMVKDGTVETLESGSITDPMQQYSFIGSQLEKLLLLKNDDITSTVEKYNKVQKGLKDKIEELQKGITKCLDEYSENAKGIYEEIKKL